jgi:DnaJ-class molecular chaperone
MLLIGEESLYTMLNVPSDATNEQISAAHRKLIIKYHPDKAENADKEMRTKQSQVK